MSVWIIEPRDPLIARDGRPFGVGPGERADSLPFPFPSTTAGGVRTRAGLDPDGAFDPHEVGRVEKIAVRGPLLVELDAAGEIRACLMPAPADALLFEVPRNARRADRKWLRPLRLPADWSSGRPADAAWGNLPAGLAPVGLPSPDLRKPLAAPPRFWSWSAFAAWLAAPVEGPRTLRSLGHNGPQRETRMHVSIDSSSLTALEGALFRTSGLEFTGARADDRAGGTFGRLALAVETAEDLTGKPGVLAPLGGERRLVAWRLSAKALPRCPDTVRAAIRHDKHCRVILLTPACFSQGWRPHWLLQLQAGVTSTLSGAVVARPQVVSGWDLAHVNQTTGQRGRPKPSRRLAPAGSVYFLKLAGDEAAINAWIDALWMCPVSDDSGDRDAGFGLAALGAWDGTCADLVATLPDEKESAP